MSTDVVSAFIGAGGWGYFAGGLKAYARAFQFVEVNATFYRPIPEGRARTWRASVPSDFVFAVKAHRDVSHGDRLRASAPARDRFAQTLRVARILRSPFVILETPSSVPLAREQVAGLRELAGMTGPRVRLGLEARAHRRGPLPPPARRAMADLGILDVVDLSQSKPRVSNDTVYTRLFGPGPHNVYEFDDEELRAIDREGRDAMSVALAFHGVRMYKDASRFLTFKRTGAFPPATSAEGVNSLEEVLRPDARFPATREELLRDHGWKVIDLDGRTRAHAGELLADLPRRTFDSLEEALQALSGTVVTDPRADPRGGGGPSRPPDWGLEIL
jgi:uncharacterized protein YecE (DUF72 family)